MRPAPIARLLLCLALLLPAAVMAHPALWVVRDADTTIYLFGTVHVLPHDAAWDFAALDRALRQSDALYLEVADDDQPAMAALVLRYGMDTAHPLSSLLAPDEFDRLRHAARVADVPGGITALNLMRPWLAALTLSLAPLAKAGLDPAEGADRQLRARMAEAGKPVLGLERSEQQIHFLADLPQAQQLQMLRQAVHDTGKATAEVEKLVDAWEAGDPDAIARIENHDMRDSQPALYRSLVVERNRRWAQRIATLLKQPGTVFIAVGAAHLAGPDSVQAQLAGRGISATRL